MDYKKLETAVYCQGFVGDYIETHIAASPESRHMTELLSAWNLLSEGFDELRRENQDLQMKLYSARVALQ
jgi:hypothetical protein